MLKKLYDKSQIWFSVLWIVLYCVLMSAADALSALIGIERLVSLPVGILLSVLLLTFLYKNRLFSQYGLCRSAVKAQQMLYYVPLLLLIGVNFLCGAELRYSARETILYIFTMLCVGFLEEIIFRGFLLLAMYKENPRAAVIVSSITFGIGHIINLVNGSGAELVPNLLQVIYATAAGFMFVMLFLRSGSLLVCILTHGIFNALSAFSADATALPMQILSCVLLTLISAGYALWLAFLTKTPGRE